MGSLRVQNTAFPDDARQRVSIRLGPQAGHVAADELFRARRATSLEAAMTPRVPSRLGGAHSRDDRDVEPRTIPTALERHEAMTKD
jgi:hypothetical protein